MVEHKDVQRLAKLELGSEKLLSGYFLALALALPSGDPTRVRYARLLRDSSALLRDRLCVLDGFTQRLELDEERAKKPVL